MSFYSDKMEMEIAPVITLSPFWVYQLWSQLSNLHCLKSMCYGIIFSIQANSTGNIVYILLDFFSFHLISILNMWTYHVKNVS